MTAGVTKRAEADRTIARTVYQLLMWGFPRRTLRNRPGVCEVVGTQARIIVGRADAAQKQLGPEHIERIFEHWYRNESQSRDWRGAKRARQAPTGGELLADAGSSLFRKYSEPPLPPPLLPRRMFNKEWLVSLRPRANWGLRRYAVTLLRNGGVWPYRRRDAAYRAALRSGAPFINTPEQAKYAPQFVKLYEESMSATQGRKRILRLVPSARRNADK